MKKTIIILLLIPFALNAQELSVQSATKIIWKGKAAYSSYSPEGTLELLSGKLTLKDGLIDTLNIVIDMRSLEQENKQLQDHLLNEDLFDVELFTVATFTLTEHVNIL